MEKTSFSNPNWVCRDIWGWTAEITIRLVLFVAFGLLATVVKPFLRFVEVEDWKLYNFPHADPESISVATLALLMLLVPILLIGIVCLFGWTKMWKEAYYGHKKEMKRRVSSEIILASLSISLAYGVNGVLGELIKTQYGRPRPDFLSRCFCPDKQIYRTAYGPNLWLTLPSRSHPEAVSDLQKNALNDYTNHSPPFPYIEDVKELIDTADCINQDEHLLFSGGRKSFPSGHSSSAFAACTWCALYSYFWFGRWKSKIRIGKKRTSHPGSSAKITFLFMWMTPAIYVAISRTQDYRHHVQDVIGGAVLGILVTYASFIQYYNFWNFTLTEKSENLCSKTVKSADDDEVPMQGFPQSQREIQKINHSYSSKNNDVKNHNESVTPKKLSDVL